MKRNPIFKHLLSQWGRVSRYALALCWLTGLLLGFCAAKSADSNLLITVRALASANDVSFLSLLWISILPMFLCILSAYTGTAWLKVSVCFLKAFSFGFCMVAIQIAYSSAGWLMQLLLLFTDIMTIPALLLVSLSELKTFRIRYWTISLSLYVVAVVCIDYFYISSLLRAVFL